MKRKTNAEWLFEQVGHTGDDCLIWPFGRSSGYGMVKYGDRITYAHRVMCELAHGAPPDPSYEAAHSCGNGHEGCINPRHLDWKTHADNQRDRHEHGTIQKGRYGRLTPEQAASIRELRGKMTQREIAEMFGVTRANVGYVQRGKTHNNPLIGVRKSGRGYGALISVRPSGWGHSTPQKRLLRHTRRSAEKCS